nr:hypothetical protein [Limosilactobacillus mucosae]
MRQLLTGLASIDMPYAPQKSETKKQLRQPGFINLNDNFNSGWIPKTILQTRSSSPMTQQQSTNISQT